MLERCPCGKPSTHIVSGEGFTMQRCDADAKAMERLGWTIERVATPQEDG